MIEMYIDVDPLECFPPEKENAIFSSLGHVPDILQDAYRATRHTQKVKYWDTLGHAYGYPLFELTEAKVDNGILHYGEDEPEYPLCNFIFTKGEYGTLSIFQYPRGLVHVSGSEQFTVRLD